MPKLRIQILKLLCEYRFKPNVLFYDSINTIVDALFGDYKHWRTTGLKANLTNFEERSSLGLGHNRLAFEIDEPASAEQFRARFERAWRLYREKVKIDTLLRLGMRTQSLVPVEFTFDELTAMTCNRFLSFDGHLPDVLGKKVMDYMFNIVTAKGDYLLHVVCGPVKEAEIPQWYQPAEVQTDPGEEPKKIESPKVSLFVDVDCYIENPKWEIEKRFFDEALKLVTEVPQNIRDYALEV